MSTSFLSNLLSGKFQIKFSDLICRLFDRVTICMIAILMFNNSLVRSIDLYFYSIFCQNSEILYLAMYFLFVYDEQIWSSHPGFSHPFESQRPRRFYSFHFLRGTHVCRYTDGFCSQKIVTCTVLNGSTSPTIFVVTLVQFVIFNMFQCSFYSPIPYICILPLFSFDLYIFSSYVIVLGRY